MTANHQRYWCGVPVAITHTSSRNFSQNQCYRKPGETILDEVLQLRNGLRELLSHSHEALARFVQDTVINIDSLLPRTPQNKNELDLFKHLGYCGLESVADRFDVDDKELCAKYYRIFNMIIFNHALPALLEGRVDLVRPDRAQGPSAPRYRGCARIMATEPDINQDNLRLKIEICQGRAQDDEERLQGYLGVLLHEMCHVFIMLYGCGCMNCFSGNNRSRTGHNHHWQNISYWVRWIVQDRLDLDLDLRRNAYMVNECTGLRCDKFGVYETQSGTQLEYWGLNPGFVKAAVEQRRHVWTARRNGYVASGGDSFLKSFPTTEW